MSTQTTKYLKRFFIHSIILFVVTLFLISAIRATTVVVILRNTVKGKKANTWLARRWCTPYPSLKDAVGRALSKNPDNQSFIARNPMEQSLLFVPDYAVNLVLGQTEALWLADIEDQLPELEVVRTAPQDENIDPDIWSRPQTTASSDDTDDTTQEPSSSIGGDTIVDSNDPQYDPDAIWGAIIAPDTSIYAANGRALRTVPAGSVMNIIGQRNSDEGILYAGTIFSELGRFDRIFVKAADLEIYRGKILENTTREEREYASKRAKLLGAIAARMEELADADKSRNPHQEAYHNALRKYRAYSTEAKKLQKVRDESTGSDRISAASKLRELKQEMSLLTPTITELKQKRNDWDAANPPPPQQDPGQDPQIIRLKQELSKLSQG
jgi:hypothetical protein